MEFKLFFWESKSGNGICEISVFHLVEEEDVGEGDVGTVPVHGLDQGGVVDLGADARHAEDGEATGVALVLHVILATPHQGNAHVGEAESGVGGTARPLHLGGAATPSP